MFRTRIAARFAAAVGVVALAIPMTNAYADNLVADGDTTTTVADNALAFGSVCTGTTVTKAVALAIARNGQGNVYKNDSVVTLSSTLLTFPYGNTLTLPPNWEGSSNNTLSSSVTATASFTADSTTGNRTGSISVTAAGINQAAAPLTRTAALQTSATVVNCPPPVVTDTTKPTLTLPPPITAEATGADGATVTYSVSASDTNPASPAVSCTRPAGAVISGATFPIGTTTVTCSATDAAGNTQTGSFPVTVRDTTEPVLTNVPSNITQEATSAAGATVSFPTPSASDALGAGPVSCSASPNLTSGSTFGLGSHTVTCSSRDAAGNTGSATFTVLVQDTVGPVIGAITAPDAAEATASTGATVTYTAPSASDAVSGPANVTCRPASGSTFPLGTTPVTCSARDARDNLTTKTFDVTVKDTTAPVLVVPGDFFAEATSAAGALVTYPATASDIVDGTVTPACHPSSGSQLGLGSHLIECSATDEAKNSASQSFTVTVRDTTAPDVAEMTSQVKEATSADGAVATFTTPSATDAVGAGPVRCVSDNGLTSGDTFPIGTTTVTCSSTDAADNTGTETFTVKVQDTTAPALAHVDDIDSVEATSPRGAVVSYTVPTATDAVGAGPVSCIPASGATFALGDTMVSCWAKDAAGNEGRTSFMVTVVDTTAPGLSLPADQEIPATGLNGAVANWAAATATDLFDGSVQVTCDHASGSVFPIGTTTVNCFAVDNAGNRAQGKFAITVQRTFTGFYQPVDTGRTVNSIKNGSTLPLKFEVFAGASELTSVDIFKPLSVKQVACGSNAVLDEVEQVTTGSTALRYDSAGGQYIWNWKTPAKANTCYQVAVITVDGAELNAQFKLR